MRQEQLDRLHATLLEIMDEIDRVCRENGITYYLAGGTLLGAIRHKGFIPWDDDMDIMMKRSDYEKFCSIFDAATTESYHLQSYTNNPKYWKSFAKVCKKGTSFKQEMGLDVGIYVDIFPLDTAFDGNGLLQRLRFNLIEICDRIISYRLIQNYNPGKAKFFCFVTKCISLNRIRKFQKKLISYNLNKHNCLYLSESVSVYGAKRSLWPKSCFDKVNDSEFEGRLYQIPSEYDKILSITFNDYMVMPPVDKRRIHNPVKLSFDTSMPDEVLD